MGEQALRGAYDRQTDPRDFIRRFYRTYTASLERRPLTPEELADVRYLTESQFFAALEAAYGDRQLGPAPEDREDRRWDTEEDKGDSGKEDEIYSVNRSAVTNYREINVYGRRSTELDEIDLIEKVIYEDKNASKLYMDRPDVPQTEQQWAEKQIFKKGKNRIEALQQSEISLSSQVSSELPSIEDLQGIRKYVFRINADTPALRFAVEAQLKRLSDLFPDYNFSAIYGEE